MTNLLTVSEQLRTYNSLTLPQLLALGGQSLDGGAESPVEAWVLGPHSAVRAHTGPTNAMLTVQCALSAAPGNWIRVGSEVRPVAQGRCLIFDDSFVHELWNP